MQHITDGLWISDIAQVQRRPTCQFDTVVSVCQDAVTDNVGCEYVHVELADDEQSAREWGGSHDYQTFAEAADSVAERFRDEEVCVHCHRGRNRSAAVCAAIIAVEKDKVFIEALADVQARRYEADPKPLMRSYAQRYIREHR